MAFCLGIDSVEDAENFWQFSLSVIALWAGFLWHRMGAENLTGRGG